MRRAEILLRYDDAAATSGMKPADEIRFRVGRNDQENWTEELAPGGHQEQGESRVTVFRAPDWEKASGARVAKKDIATAPLAKEYQRLRMNAT